MNRGRWAIGGWRGVDFLKVGCIGFGICFSYPLAYADGISRITRSDVGTGEGVVNATAGSFLLQGSIGTVDVPQASVEGYFLQGGIQGNLYFPQVPPSFQVVSVTSNSINVNWVTPGSGIKFNKPLGAYQLRYLESIPITQTNFDSSNNVPVNSAMKDPGADFPGEPQKVIGVTGLKYNTTYYLGLAALDSDKTKNRSYATTTSACTLAPEVTEISYDEKFQSKKITVKFNPNNSFQDSFFFQGELSEFSNFGSGVSTQTTTNSHKSSVSLDFTELDTNKTYYFRVRVKNRVGAFTPWYPAEPVQMGFPNPIPTKVTMAESEVFSTSATLRWELAGLPIENIYRAQISKDNFVSVYGSSDYLIDGSSYPFTGLNPNTEYQFRVIVFNSHYETLGFTSPPISAVTSVSRVTGVSMDQVYITSATVQWADDALANGTDPHFYSVQISSESPTSGFRTLSPEASYPPEPFSITGLPINTKHYVRVLSANKNHTPSAEGPSDVAVFCTGAVAPGSISFSDPTDPRSEISISWTHNGNNPSSRYMVDLSRDATFGSVLASATLPPGKSTHVFQNLDPEHPGVPILANELHHLRVRTIQESDGLPLNSSVSTGSWTTAPLAPTSLSLESQVNDLKVHWTNIAGVIMNSTNTFYSVDWSTSPTVDYTSIIPKLYSLPVSVGAPRLLIPNTTYQVRVTALRQNDSSFGNIAATTDSVTLANKPTIPPPPPHRPPRIFFKVRLRLDGKPREIHPTRCTGLICRPVPLFLWKKQQRFMSRGIRMFFQAWCPIAVIIPGYGRSIGKVFGRILPLPPIPSSNPCLRATCISFTPSIRPI